MHPLAMGSLLAQQSGGALSANVVMLLLIGVVFYLLLIRPQQRRARAHQELVKAVGVGDRIVTIGGMHGTVVSIDDETVRLEVSPGNIVTFNRSAIARQVVDADKGVDTTTDGPESTDAS